MTEIFDFIPILSTRKVSYSFFAVIHRSVLYRLCCIGVLHPQARENEYIFTYIMFNVITFTRAIPPTGAINFALGLFDIWYFALSNRAHSNPQPYLSICGDLIRSQCGCQRKDQLGEVLLSNMLITGLILFIERLRGSPTAEK